MQNIRKVTFAILCLLGAVSMTACGGGGGGGGGGITPVPGAAVSKGVVTALGSVVVNGVTFNVDNATVTIDGASATKNDLKVGMVVKVRGSSDDASKTGTATKVEAMDALEGTIDVGGVDPVNKTIKVMGQVVRIEDNATRLSDDNTVKTFAAATFAAGDKVEVHAVPDDLGGLRAARVVKKAQVDFEIKGFVTSTTTPFGLALTPGGAAVLTVTGTLPVGAVVGSFVEVKATGAPAGGTITAIANGVTLEDALGVAGEKVEVEGVVSSGDVNSFVVNGQKVITSSATVFDGGLKADFAVGAKVEAEGNIDANGVITATKVTFRSNIRFEGNASEVTATSLKVLGQTVLINPDPMTRKDLISNAPIADGDHVEVRAFLGSDGTTLVASRIRVRNPDTRAFLQGPVTAVNSAAGTLTIFGIPVTIGSSTEFRGSFNASELAISQAAFFAQIIPNVTVVKVRWRPFVNLTTAVDQAEIETGNSLTSSNDSTSNGVVTAKGSVFVNGVRFHTGGAAVMIDGVPATEDKLQVGMVVKVRGTIDDATQTGTATLVEASNVLAGTISAKDDAKKTLTVLGQTVQIEDNVTNLLDDTAKVFTPTDFAVGERVEVHGVFDDLGNLRATRVVKNAGEFQVKGFVKSLGSPFNLSVGAKSFSVTGTLPAGAKIDSIVEVHATTAPSDTGAVTATLVKLEDNIGVAGEKTRVEGIVEAGGTADSFTINGQKVVTDPATLFEGGLKADFAVGLKVEAQGPLNADGAIVAVRVSFRSSIRIEGIATVTPTGLTLLGLPVVINESTRVKAVFVDGDQVEVRAFIDRKGNFVATRVVKRSNVDGKAFLQGPVKLVNATTMSILGVNINTASTQFRLSTDQAVDQIITDPAIFFAQLKDNVTVVKVRWDVFTATTAAVNQAEIQLGKL